MKPRKAIAFLMPLLPFFFFGQETPQISAKDSIVKSSWMVSLGFNVVDDSGDEFGNLLDIRDGWNAVPFPSRVSIGRYFQNGLGLEAIASYNQYQEGKIVDNVVNPEDVDYFGIDFRISYDLNQIIGETGFFDPYVGIGAGYTDANNQGRGTYNAVIGFRTWFSDRVGLDFNSTGKWATNTDNATNHIQHAVGVVYQFDIKKGLSPRGEEKLALLKELEAEQKRVQDSIAAKEKADEEARLLAERLKQEQEAARLAEAERKKREAEERRRALIKKEIDDLGNVYFALNSSYLTRKDKQILDKLVAIMDKYPDLEIEVTAHTDSRGTEQYNQWLSEKRAERTVAYLLKKNVAENRIKSSGFGEKRLVNECGDGVPCSESKHSENRRSELTIIWY